MSGSELFVGRCVIMKRTEIVITGKSEEARAILRNRSIRVNRLPYSVGRSSGNVIIDLLEKKNLSLIDFQPYSVSRRHFDIVEKGNTYYVVDRDSTLGTIVNGKRIGRKSGHRAVILKHGDNEIVVGGRKSPYVFTIHVNEEKEKLKQHSN